MDAGAPVERVDLEARVVGERGAADRRDESARLDARVLEVAFAGLLGSAIRRRRGYEVQHRCEQDRELANLARVRRRERDDHARRSDACCAASRRRIPDQASFAMSSACDLVKGTASAVPWIST